MENLSIKELLRSKEEKRILTGRISGIEDEYYKYKNENIPCAIVWYKELKILIPSTHLGTKTINKSMIRGMLGAEIDFIVMEIDTLSNIAIRFNNYPHYLDNVLIKVTKIKEDKKLIHGYLMRII